MDSYACQSSIVDCCRSAMSGAVCKDHATGSIQVLGAVMQALHLRPAMHEADGVALPSYILHTIGCQPGLAGGAGTHFDQS